MLQDAGLYNQPSQWRKGHVESEIQWGPAQAAAGSWSQSFASPRTPSPSPSSIPEKYHVFTVRNKNGNFKSRKNPTNDFFAIKF